ncbi:phosphatidate cytidylyltransferase [Thermovibrio sp.]
MKDRIIGAFIVVVYALLMYLLPYNYYYSLVYLLGVFMTVELFKISSHEKLLTWGVLLFSIAYFIAVNLPAILSLLSTLFSSLSILFYSGTFFSYLLIILPAFFSLSLLFLSLLTYGEVKSGFFPVLFFLVYITFGTVALAKLTKPYFLLLLSIVWSTDTFAYLVGKYFGKRRITPTVSPKKTLEGSLGGSAAGALLSLFIGSKLGLFEPSLESFLLLTFLTVVSQLGDLLESALKRLFGVKDSGSTIPGHGGVLDRLDSTLAVAPFLLVMGGLS